MVEEEEEGQMLVVGKDGAITIDTVTVLEAATTAEEGPRGHHPIHLVAAIEDKATVTTLARTIAMTMSRLLFRILAVVVVVVTTGD